MADAKVERVQGTITFTDGEEVEFGFGPGEDWRSGNLTTVLGRAVDVTEAMRFALHDRELIADREDGEEADDVEADD